MSWALVPRLDQAPKLQTPKGSVSHGFTKYLAQTLTRSQVQTDGIIWSPLGGSRDLEAFLQSH